MSKDNDDKFHTEEPELEFSLEDILAEYGQESQKEPDARTPIPLDQYRDREEPEPADPTPPRGGRGGKRARGHLLTFPGHSTAEEKKQDAVEEPAPPQEQTPEPDPPEPKSSEPKPPESKTPKPKAPSGGRRLAQKPEPARNAEKAGEPEPEPPIPEGEEPASSQPQKKEKVVPFPGGEEKGLLGRFRKLKKQADAYADHMFEEEGSEEAPEVRRAERYIPGVDVEEPEEERPPRRKRRPPPPIPDTPPQELFRRYNRGMGVLKLRIVLLFLLCVPLLYLSVGQAVNAPMPGTLEGNHALQLYAQAALLGAAMLLGIDALGRGLYHLLILHVELDSVMALACAAALADALTMPLMEGSPQRQPYCAIAALALGFNLYGYYCKRKGLRVACRTAASASEPYLVTLDENKWNGRDAYAKWSGEPVGFGRQIQATDGAQRIYHIMAPLILLACLLFSVLASIGRRRPEDILWCLSATLSAGASFSSTLCYGIPWRSLSLRLAKSGAALAGWDGITGTSGSAGILLTDQDLFPPGTVSLNGIKIFGDFPVEKVVGVTATLIRDTGCGLDKIFHDLLRSQGAIYRRSQDFCCYEGGGVSALIRNEVVLVGSASFMHLMEVPLPQGLNVKNAVFCAIDGELAGLFALKYTLHGTVEPAISALISNRISPVLATRDFNIIPAMLRQRFKLPADKMEFPAVERRVELSSQRQSHSELLTAVLCREGVGPFTEAAVGGKRLRLAVRISTALACLGSCVGVLLAFYLTFMAAYDSLTPFNLLVFLGMWLVPTILISNWVNRY